MHDKRTEATVPLQSAAMLWFSPNDLVALQAAASADPALRAGMLAVSPRALIAGWEDLDKVATALLAGLSREFLWPALHRAAWDGDGALVERLHAMGACAEEFVQRRPSAARTALLVAASRGHTRIVELLARLGSSVHVADEVVRPSACWIHVLADGVDSCVGRRERGAR